MNLNPTTWLLKAKDTIKIASLNCAGLKAHYEDIKADGNLLNADIILFQETSLLEVDYQEYPLPNHPHYIHVIISQGRGISAYSKKKWQKVQVEKYKDMQLLHLTYDGLSIINVYRSSDCSQNLLCDKISKYIRDKDPCLVLGDFNICSRLQKQSTIANCFATHGLNQLVKESTHIKGRVIDHIYSR